MTTLYLARHGQSVSNFLYEQGLDPQTSGEFGSDLTELGERQAAKLAKQLSRVHFDVVYSSHLARAHKTAQAVVKTRNASVIVVRDLKEIDDEDELVAANRFTSAVRTILNNHSGQTILIVAHGFVMRKFLEQIGLTEADELEAGDIENTGYLIVEASEEAIDLVGTKGVKKNILRHR